MEHPIQAHPTNHVWLHLRVAGHGVDSVGAASDLFHGTELCLQSSGLFALSEVQQHHRGLANPVVCLHCPVRDLRLDHRSRIRLHQCTSLHEINRPVGSAVHLRRRQCTELRSHTGHGESETPVDVCLAGRCRFGRRHHVLHHLPSRSSTETCERDVVIQTHLSLILLCRKHVIHTHINTVFIDNAEKTPTDLPRIPHPISPLAPLAERCSKQFDRLSET